MQKQYRPGDLVEVAIHGLGHAGEGVGRVQNLAVFVPGALPGEKIRTKLTQVKKTFARGELVEILQRGTARIESACSLAQNCGGCQLQHLDYQKQLEHKRESVENALTRLGKLEGVPVLPTLGMATPWHYRNKIHLQVHREGGKTKLGFFQEGSYQLAAGLGQQTCLLVDQRINQVITTLEILLNETSKNQGQVPEPFHWRTQTGLLRHVMIRRGHVSGQIMVVLVTSDQRWPGAKAFAQSLVQHHPEVVSVIRNINTSPERVVLGSENQVLAGQETILDTLNGLTYKISATSFYQINSAQTEVLYNKALELADLRGDELVVDAYCGIGTIATFLARHARQVIGLEIIPTAVEDARENAALNNQTNTEFRLGPVEKLLPQMVQRGLKPDLVVLDPPRKGCDTAVLEALAQSQVPRLVYVSCDPATLARDLGMLDQLGYQTQMAQPVDLFPWTSHVETVVLMSRKDK